ncbi:MAG: helix-turn-helix domain-containing protein, partial [Planctomycetota bacterium]
MAKKTEHISTSEFSSLSGLSVSQVSKLLRDGKIKGVKKSGTWMISRSQLKLKAVQEMVKFKKPAPSKTKSKKSRKDPDSVKKTTAEAKKQKDQIQKESLPPAAAPAPNKTVREKTYSVAEFSAMTYLTDFGVMDWLKKGRIKGI